jgi:uncharacterized repeat protein (TIGR01451 family)
MLLVCLYPGLSGRAWAQEESSARAFGERVELRVLRLLGPGIEVKSGPLPEVSGPPAPAPGQTKTVATARVALGGLGTVLKANVLTAHTEVPAGGGLSAEARVTDLALDLVPVFRLLKVGADVVESRAGISGSCGGDLTAAGGTTLANARAASLLGLALRIDASPAPNTVLLNLLGLRVVLNEQIVGGDGVSGRSIAVNAIHVSLNNALLTGLGLLSGDVVIAHSEARVACPPVPEDADLRLEKTADSELVFLGEDVVYTLRVTNLGPAPATDVVLTDFLPNRLSMKSVTASAGTCDDSSNPLICDLGTLEAGSEVVITLVMGAESTGVFLNEAFATSTMADPDELNNQSSVVVTVVRP